MHYNDQILTYENMIDQFLKDFPEFKEKAEEERKWWHGDPDDEPLVYIFFSYVVNEYLMKEGLVKMDKPQLLIRLFEFMERWLFLLMNKLPIYLGQEY
jgi:hypothetical protein